MPNLGHRKARNIQGREHQARVATHQGNARRLHCHIGAAAIRVGHGHAHIRGGQGRRIVYAIAHHGHGMGLAAMACGFQITHALRFVAG